MRGFLTLFLLLGSCIMMFDAVAAASVSSSPLETYIVHVEPPSETANAQNELSELERYYLSFMPTVSRAGEEEPRILFSYENVFFGFAATLSEEDVKEMETKPGFIFAEKEEILTLDTTNSPSFLGLSRNSGFWHDSNYGRGIIIGVLDTGINPDHPSFSDAGMPSRPATWRGRCEFSRPSACNNKVIGARSLVGGEPLDGNGHGSHVAGIAAGNFVDGANFNGHASGTAAGIAPLAHLAVYKVCDDRGSCPDSAVLAALDFAIADGVDIISMSIGSGSRPFYRSNAAIGAFAAVERGIFVSCSAGNSGPALETLSNEAPWVLTVGSSTTDRRIGSNVRLGNNRIYFGQSAFPRNSHALLNFPLAYPGLIAFDPNFANCGRSRFPMAVSGRIVICFTGGWASPIQKGINVRDAGGQGMILINQEELGNSTRAEPHVLPTSHVSYADGLEIIAYLISTGSPTATLPVPGTLLGDPMAPRVSHFSSRGPNRESFEILKPDILGPGEDILAASHNSGAFTLMSGTSMACPHLSGVAALLKSTHPNWSPSAIKSALMTTAQVLNDRNSPIVDHLQQPTTPLAMGSGQVNPSRARNPGLIYDITVDDYISYLCGLGYTHQQVQIIARRSVDCTSSIGSSTLNYPSITANFPTRNAQNHRRTLTNVGSSAPITYNVRVEQQRGLHITVSPTTLTFTSLNQRLLYTARINLLTSERGFANESVHEGSLSTSNLRRLYQGSITWHSGNLFAVRIPVVALIYTSTPAPFLDSTVPLMEYSEELPRSSSM